MLLERANKKRSHCLRNTTIANKGFDTRILGRTMVHAWEPAFTVIKSAECPAISCTGSHAHLFCSLYARPLQKNRMFYWKSSVSYMWLWDRMCHHWYWAVHFFINEEFMLSLCSFNRKSHVFFVQIHCELFLAKTKWKTPSTALTSQKTVSWRWVLVLTHILSSMCCSMWNTPTLLHVCTSSDSLPTHK